MMHGPINIRPWQLSKEIKVFIFILLHLNTQFSVFNESLKIKNCRILVNETRPQILSSVQTYKMVEQLAHSNDLGLAG